MIKPFRFLQAEQIIHQYNSSEPLSHFLKTYYKENKYLGKKDRFELSDIIYKYFRKKIFFPELEEVNPENIRMIFDAEIVFQEDSIHFPFHESMSLEIDRNGFFLQLLEQGDVWIHIAPPFADKVRKELKEKSYIPILEKGNALCFEKNTPLEMTNAYQKGYFRVQDFSTNFSIHGFCKPKTNSRWWDVCAGSGGKSLSLIELNPEIRIFGTDIRGWKLKEFQLRMENSRFFDFETAAMDLTQRPSGFSAIFDGIIIDAPCTGSGTWFRTPERMQQITKEDIQMYENIQRKILQTTSEYLSDNGVIHYITCSIYADENEKIINGFLEQNQNFELTEMCYIKGYEFGAENIFTALIQRKK